MMWSIYLINTLASTAIRVLTYTGIGVVFRVTIIITMMHVDVCVCVCVVLATTQMAPFHLRSGGKLLVYTSYTSDR